jgi:hypothetical protein
MDVVDSQATAKGDGGVHSTPRRLLFLPLLLTGLVLLLLVVDSYGTSAGDLAGPYYDLDGSGEDVSLDSPVRVVVNKPMSLSA